MGDSFVSSVISEYLGVAHALISLMNDTRRIKEIRSAETPDSRFSEHHLLCYEAYYALLRHSGVFVASLSTCWRSQSVSTYNLLVCDKAHAQRSHVYK